MSKKTTRFLLIILCLALVAAGNVWAQEEAVNRYAQIFNAAPDPGRLTARFLKLSTRSEDKSGECTILTSPDGQVMIIDAGNPTCFPDVDRALKALGITRIDYLVASHPHVDHIGSFAELIQSYEVGAVYSSEVVYPSTHYYNYREALVETKTPHIILSAGDSFLFGAEVLVEVLHPPAGIEYYPGYPAGSTQFVNNLSLVLKLTYAQSSFLFPGDLYTDGERKVLARHPQCLGADVLKICHHGDKTSSSRGFRQAVQAQIGIMMHDAIADLNVYRKFRRENTTVYITSIDGSVLVSTTGDGKYAVISQYERTTSFLD